MQVLLAQLNPYYQWFLPVAMSVLAGLLQHDRFSEQVNEYLCYLVIGLVAVLNAFFAGKIGGNLVLDAMVLIAYAKVAMGLPVLAWTQAYLKSNVTLFGKGTAVGTSSPSSPGLDLEALAISLAQELLKNKDIARIIDKQITGVQPVVTVPSMANTTAIADVTATSITLPALPAGS